MDHKTTPTAHEQHHNLCNEKIVRWPAVHSRVGLSRSHVHQLVAEGQFPAPIKLGPRASGWIESEIDQWLTVRVEESRGASLDKSRECEL